MPFPAIHDVGAPIQPSLCCYDADAKRRQTRSMRSFYRRAAKDLREFRFKTHYNPGGIAVWGETYVKLYRDDGTPAVEAYDTDMGILVRQWDGRYSGQNHYVGTLFTFIRLVRELAEKPFRRF